MSWKNEIFCSNYSFFYIFLINIISKYNPFIVGKTSTTDLSPQNCPKNFQNKFTVLKLWAIPPNTPSPTPYDYGPALKWKIIPVYHAYINISNKHIINKSTITTNYYFSGP